MSHQGGLAAGSLPTEPVKTISRLKPLWEVAPICSVLLVSLEYPFERRLMRFSDFFVALADAGKIKRV
jgi:hypothetical protein